MTQPKFTPGPWEHDSGMYGNGKRYHSIFATADNVVIAEFNPMSHFNPEQGKANAVLIAEAPTAHDLIVRAVTGIDIEWIVEAHAYLGKVAGGAQ